MPLFHLDGKPIKFYLIGVEEPDLTTLKDLIKKNGGVLTDDEDSIVKFTSAKTYTDQKYPVSRIYDFRFIMEADRLLKFPEHEKFRLNPKQDDEFIMSHFLYGHLYCEKCDCDKKKKEQQAEEDSLLPTDIVIETEEKESLEERGMQTDDVTSLDNSQLNPNDEIPMETLESSNLAETTENEKVVNALSFPQRGIDESQAVVTEAEMINDLPLTGAGDIGEINRSPRNSNEKRPCNVEYELNVKPKLTELMDKQKAIDAAQKDLIPSGNRHLTRSPRTRTKRNSERLSSESQDSNDEINPLEGEPTETTIIAPAEILSQNTILEISDSPVIDMEIEPNLLAESEKESNEGPRDNNSENGNKGEKNGKSKKQISDENRSSTGEDYKSPSKDNGHVNGAIDKRKKTKAKDNQNNVGDEKGKKSLKTIDVEYDDSDSDESSKSLSSTSSATNYLTATSSANADIILNSSPSKKRPNRKRSLSLNEAGPSRVVKNKRLNRSDDNGAVQNEKINHNDGNDDEDNTKEKTKTKKSNIQKSSKMTSEKSSDEEVISDYDDEGMDGDYFDEDDDDDDIDEEAVARERSRPAENSTAKCKEWRDRMKSQLCKRDVARRAFEAEERKEMLKYLIRRQKIKYAKGLVVWKEMIEDGILEHRTPGSLQNHFLKFILPNIEHARIDEESMQEFLNLRNE